MGTPFDNRILIDTATQAFPAIAADGEPDAREECGQHGHQERLVWHVEGAVSHTGANECDELLGCVAIRFFAH